MHKLLSYISFSRHKVTSLQLYIRHSTGAGCNKAEIHRKKKLMLYKAPLKNKKTQKRLGRHEVTF